MSYDIYIINYYAVLDIKLLFLGEITMNILYIFVIYYVMIKSLYKIIYKHMTRNLLLLQWRFYHVFHRFITVAPIY